MLTSLSVFCSLAWTGFRNCLAWSRYPSFIYYVWCPLIVVDKYEQVTTYWCYRDASCLSCNWRWFFHITESFSSTGGSSHILPTAVCDLDVCANRNKKNRDGRKMSNNHVNKRPNSVTSESKTSTFFHSDMQPHHLMHARLLLYNGVSI